VEEDDDWGDTPGRQPRRGVRPAGVLPAATPTPSQQQRLQ